MVKQGERVLCRYIKNETNVNELLEACAKHGDGALKYPIGSEREGFNVGINAQLIAGDYIWEPTEGDHQSCRIFQARSMQISGLFSDPSFKSA